MNTMILRWSLTLLFLLAASGHSLVSAAEVSRSVAPHHCRIVWKSDPQTTATLSWSTTSGGERHGVRYRPRDAKAWLFCKAHRNGLHHGAKASAPLYFHHARLSGLQPATEYELYVESDDQTSKRFWFVTAPDQPSPVSMIYGGDSRSVWEDRRKVNQLIARTVAEQRRAGRPRVFAFAHGGDFILDGRRLEEWRQWLADHELTTGPEGRLLPLIPTRGNHDLGPLFDEVFDFPKGDDNYYALDLTPAIRWITLNTEIPTAGDQRSWLDSELANSRPQRTWVVCQYHRPAFPAVKTPSSAYANWVPLFERHQVDLACEADGHCIKRTGPLRENQFDPTGVVYIGEGGLGVRQRTPKESSWYLQPPAKTGAGHHIHLLTFDDQRLVGRVLMLEGGVFDEFALEARGFSPPANEP